MGILGRRRKDSSFSVEERPLEPNKGLVTHVALRPSSLQGQYARPRWEESCMFLTGSILDPFSSSTFHSVPGLLLFIERGNR